MLTIYCKIEESNALQNKIPQMTACADRQQNPASENITHFAISHIPTAACADSRKWADSERAPLSENHV